MTTAGRPASLPESPRAGVSGGWRAGLVLLAAGLALGIGVVGGAQGRQSGATPPAGEEPEWWAVDKAVVSELMTQDIATLMRSKRQKGSSADVGQKLALFDLLVRAGHRGMAMKAIDHLLSGRIIPESSQVSQIADFLIERQEWDLTRHFLEQAPQAEPGWGYVFIKQWAETGDHRDIDRWLAERGKTNPLYWLRERCRFRAALGTEGALLDTLAAEVRSRPADPGSAERFLDAVSAVGQEIDIDWMGDVCKPRLAFESFLLGQAVAPRSPRAAIALLERSLAAPFTDEDQRRIDQDMRHRMAALILPRDWERDFHLWSKEALARCYQANSQSEKAQPLIEELAAAGRDRLPHVSWSQFAGQVQADSGQRVIENRFMEAESEDRQSSQYWLSRALYYVGRQEDARAVEAFEKALECVPLAQLDESRAAARHRIVYEFASYRGKTGGDREAVSVLRKEFDAVPLQSAYATWLVQDLSQFERDDNRYLRPDDDRLWSYLDVRKEWGYAEEKLLWRMVKNTPDEDRNATWDRAERLARDGHPSRALKLGWIMTRSNESDRAIPLLKEAAARLPEGRNPTGIDRWTAAITLFEAYLDTGRWREAEEVWPAARERLTPREIPDWLGKIAIEAAKEGAIDDALRLWRMKVNLDRTDFRHMDAIVRLGLTHELKIFYQRMAEADPDTWVPDAALKLLRN